MIFSVLCGRIVDEFKFKLKLTGYRGIAIAKLSDLILLIDYFMLIFYCCFAIIKVFLKAITTLLCFVDKNVWQILSSAN